jgi:RNA recognition motif-containing protein
MHTLRINNVFDADEEDIRREFEVYGRLGDVYRPINKDKMTETPFLFVRFIERENMLLAMNALQGKVIRGRKMVIEEAKPVFELETSIY